MTPLSLPVVVAVGAFVSVGGLAFAAWIWLRGRRKPRPLKKARLTPPITNARLSPGMEKVGAILESLAAPRVETERSDLERRMSQANWRRPVDLQIYLGARVVLGVLLPVLLLLAAHPSQWVPRVGAVLVGIALGYYSPALVLHLKRAQRQEKLMQAFPDALDMLVSAIGAGLGLDAALQRMGRELGSSAPELASELSLVVTETAAGIPRYEALQRLDERTGLAEIRSLVSVVTQAERYGVGVATALRAHAQLVRARRGLAAESRAAEAAPKLTVVMILFILPPLFVVVLGPAAVNIVDNIVNLKSNARHVR